MGSRLKVLVVSLMLAGATGAAAQSASAAQSAVPLVYRGAGTLRAGNVSFKSAAQWNVNRWSRGRYSLAGRVARGSTASQRWNVYRGRTFAGYVALGPVGRWRLYRAGKPVGYTKLVAGRWWVYRGTRRVGTVSASPGGPAAGAGLLLLV
jgi:hypothetical protein